MTTEKLLEPRWKVIADYPNSILPVGAVFYMDKLYAYIKSPNGAVSQQSNYYIQNPDKYPNVFRKLFWWEERSIEDMPEYVKYTIDGKYYELRSLPFSDGTYKMGEYASGIRNFIPATAAEYHSYISSKG